MNSGVSKLIGQAVHRQILLHDNSSKPVLIGMTSWNILTNNARQYIEKQVENLLMLCHVSSYMYDFFSKGIAGVMNMEYLFTCGSLSPLDRHHTHCLLLDNYHPNLFLNDEARSRFVQVMCGKRKCHGVTVIVEGGRYTLKVILNDVKNKRPVVIVRGSGRVASLLGMLLKTTDNKKEIT